MRRRWISVLVFIFIFSPLYSCAESANISAFVFTTEQRTVAVGQISDAITVQTQNSSGTAEKVDETNDVTFTSNSGTGEFLGSTGNSVTTTMSKNTSSRTFYYRDSTNGTYTITVHIQGRETGKEFTATQTITVGSAGSGAGDTNDDTNNDSTDNTDNTEDNNTEGEENTENTGSGGTVSSHSNPVSLSTYKKKINSNFKIDAGRKRLVTINTPVEFSAHASSDNLEKSAKFSWSFGDGSMVRGKDAEHTYLFPGTYNVVLNAEFGDSKAVARTEVQVVAPKLSVTNEGFGEDGFIEIKNSDKTEINLEHWVVSNGNEAFIFAPDTIVSGGKSITFPFPHFSNEAKVFFPNKKELALSNIQKTEVALVQPITQPVVQIEAKEDEQPVVITEKKEEKDVATTTLETEAPNKRSSNAALIIEAFKKEEEEDVWADKGWKFLRDILNR